MNRRTFFRALGTLAVASQLPTLPSSLFTAVDRPVHVVITQRKLMARIRISGDLIAETHSGAFIDAATQEWAHAMRAMCRDLLDRNLLDLDLDGRMVE